MNEGSGSQATHPQGEGLGVVIIPCADDVEALGLRATLNAAGIAARCRPDRNGVEVSDAEAAQAFMRKIAGVYARRHRAEEMQRAHDAAKRATWVNAGWIALAMILLIWRVCSV